MIGGWGRRRSTGRRRRGAALLAVSFERPAASGAVREQKSLKRLAGPRFPRGNVPCDLVLIEHAVDRGKKARQLDRELGMILRRVGKRRGFFANQIAERALCAKAPLDGARGPALINPDFLESYGPNIVKRRPVGNRKAQDVWPDRIAPARAERIQP